MVLSQNVELISDNIFVMKICNSIIVIKPFLDYILVRAIYTKALKVPGYESDFLMHSGPLIKELDVLANEDLMS
jgi:hypothetical protein